MRLPHRLQGQKVKSQGKVGAYCGGDLAAQFVDFSKAFDVVDHLVLLSNFPSLICNHFIFDMPYSQVITCGNPVDLFAVAVAY